MSSHAQAQWTAVEWTPCGHLLVACWVTKHCVRQQGCTIFDPYTLEKVIVVPQQSECIHRAAKPASFMQSPSLSAFFPEIGWYVSFSCHASCCWTYSTCDCPEPLWPHASVLSPDGAALVGPQGSRLAPGSEWAFHSSLDPCSSDAAIMPELPIWWSGNAESAGVWVQYAPLPRCWPQIYAYLHESRAARKRS